MGTRPVLCPFVPWMREPDDLISETPIPIPAGRGTSRSPIMALSATDLDTLETETETVKAKAGVRRNRVLDCLNGWATPGPTLLFGGLFDIHGWRKKA
jgi:hypothetical protein